jgi:deoxyribodipyrimidine photo-lyase
VSSPDRFPPRLDEAHARIAAVEPAAYARTRNALDGAVTRLSPYITHGVVTLPEVLAGVAVRHRFDHQHQFVFELGWREYFRHVWQHRGDAIFESLHPGPLPDAAYARELPADIREARTGVPVIDASVRALYATGYLHNHARLWLASYVVHLRRVHWRAGADWLYAHLLDGDLASNHLSWQWVAGTGSHKPYLFNADNVARHAPVALYSRGSAIDASYEALDAIARGAPPLPAPAGGEGIAEPGLHQRPTGALRTTEPGSVRVAGRDVWLVHPWALRAPPVDMPADTLCLGLVPAALHERWPWSASRWAFVGSRMTALTPHCWYGDAEAIGQALRGARSVRVARDLHLPRSLEALATRHSPSRLFGEVARPCASFSQWWKQATREVHGLADLPGMRRAACRLSPDAAASQPPQEVNRCLAGTNGAAVGGFTSVRPLVK